jgi:hypothetical protein
VEPRASGLVFFFCVPGLIFGGNEGVGSRFHVLRSRSRFPRNRGRRVPFSSIPLPYSFFDDTAGIGSRFHVLRAVRPFFARSAPPLAMGCGRRTRRSLPSVHLFNAG